MAPNVRFRGEMRIREDVLGGVWLFALNAESFVSSVLPFHFTQISFPVSYFADFL